MKNSRTSLQMAALLATVLSGYIPSVEVKRMDKCNLPNCDKLHSHNGGYCCAEHCFEHRQKLKLTTPPKK